MQSVLNSARWQQQTAGRQASRAEQLLLKQQLHQGTAVVLLQPQVLALLEAAAATTARNPRDC